MTEIVVVSRYWYPTIKGGAEKFISKLSNGLYKIGYNVIGLTKSLKNREYPSSNHPLIYYIEPFNLPHLSSVIFSTWAALKVNHLRPDVAIVNGYWAESSPILIKKEIPRIVVIHDVGLFTSKIATKNRIKYLLRTIVLRKVTRRADIIVVPVKKVKDDLANFLGVSKEKIKVIGFEGTEGPLRYEHIDNEFFDIVQVGRFAPNKGHILLLEAFEKVLELLPNARLWLVGSKLVSKEHTIYFREVLERARRINKKFRRKVVTIIVDAPSVDEYYRIADICVAPSIAEEGYGLAVLECMAYGKPVIASDIFVETGVANTERSFIVRRNNIEDIIQGILTLYNDKNLYKKLSNRGLEYARKCSWENIVYFFDSLIKQIIEDG